MPVGGEFDIVNGHIIGMPGHNHVKGAHGILVFLEQTSQNLSLLLHLRAEIRTGGSEKHIVFNGDQNVGTGILDSDGILQTLIDDIVIQGEVQVLKTLIGLCFRLLYLGLIHVGIRERELHSLGGGAAKSGIHRCHHRIKFRLIHRAYGKHNDKQRQQ